MLTPAQIEAERATVHAILSPWMKAAHKRARRKHAIAFREAADMQDLWRWLHANRWETAGQRET